MPCSKGQNEMFSGPRGPQRAQTSSAPLLPLSLSSLGFPSTNKFPMSPRPQWPFGLSRVSRSSKYPKDHQSPQEGMAGAHCMGKGSGGTRK